MVQQYTRAVAADTRCSKRKNAHGVSLIWRQAEESAQDKAGTRRARWGRRRGGGEERRWLKSAGVVEMPDIETSDDAAAIARTRTLWPASDVRGPSSCTDKETAPSEHV